MYNTGKKVSLKRVLEKVYRDYGFNTEIQWSDIIEWSSEAINLLGIALGYEDKVSKEITIENFRGELPCDIMHIKGVRDFNTQRVYVRAFDQFHPSNYYRCDDERVSQNDTDLLYLTYTTNDNFIFTSEETGSIEIAYRGMSLDEEGLPTIPDNDKYIRAVAAYIAERIGFKLYLQDKMSGDKYHKIESDRDWAFGSANSLEIPDVDQMQSLTNQMLRLVPAINQHSSSFKFSAYPSQQINHNSY